jgi:pimeloyl-ACP methyl ester carboxylesterase
VGLQTVRTATVIAATCLLAGCGGGGPQDEKVAAPFERVHFRAADGVRLDGRLFGSGRFGIVLVHMGRGGDSQADWLGLAERLARDGYLVLSYNRRGVCPGGRAGCSGGADDYAASWKDVVGAARFIRSKGAERIGFVGASIGAMSSLYAASQRQIDPIALVEFAGINHASGYDFDRAQVRRVPGHKLFLSSRADIYGGADAAREWYGWAKPPKRLELVPGSEHGTDLLRPGNPLRRRVSDLIVRFLDGAMPPTL